MLFSVSYKWLHFECNCHFKSVLQSIYCRGVCQSQALPLDTLLSPMGFAGIDLEPYILTVKSQCTRPIIHSLSALILIALYSVFMTSWYLLSHRVQWRNHDFMKGDSIFQKFPWHPAGRALTSDWCLNNFMAVYEKMFLVVLRTECSNRTWKLNIKKFS